MGNDISELEKALAETWKSKEMFYEKYKGLSALEILNRIEQKYAKETLDKSAPSLQCTMCRIRPARRAERG